MKQFTRHPNTIFAATLIVLFSAACTDDGQVTGDGEEGDTGGGDGGPLDEGVYINCLNENNLNSWWVFAPGPTIEQKFGGPGQYLNACIGPANMGAGFNLVDDWDEEAYGYPSFDSEIRALCSKRCRQAHKTQTGQTEVCEDANWSGHAVIELDYDPAVDGSNCNVSEVHPLITNDPDASEINWNEGTGSPLSLPLNCSLLSDCSDEFDADIDEWTLAFNSGGASGPIDPDTRDASYHSVTGLTGTSIALDMNSGNGSGYDDENPLDGHAEYSPSYCGSSTCPFYLAAFEAGNTTDEWTIHLDVPPVVSEHKEISNVQIDLLQSTLGVWRPSTGRVAFPPGSLVFQLDFELSSDTCTGACSHFGDGIYSRTLVNLEVVFGTFDPVDGLTLDYRFPIIGGEASLAVELTPDGHPPEALINLGSQPRCNHADGYELTASEDASVDQDSDLDYTVWYVDGAVRASGYVIPVGVHTIDLLAVDDRGAHDFAGPQTLEIIQGPACL